MHAPTRTRPRVEGEREGEILAATRDLLLEHGYDRLTLAEIAVEARASKATLYRRWDGKLDLVIDAVAYVFGESAEVDDDTGTLRGDLIAAMARRGSLLDAWIDLLGALIPAMLRDGALAAAFRDRVQERFGATALRPYERARDRGEIGPDADLGLLAGIVPSLCSHELFALGRVPDPDRVAVIVDTVLLPACRASLPSAEPAR